MVEATERGQLMAQNRKVAVVTGGSAGVGRATSPVSWASMHRGALLSGTAGVVALAGAGWKLARR
jgi:hypothetical protein